MRCSIFFVKQPNLSSDQSGCGYKQKSLNKNGDRFNLPPFLFKLLTFFTVTLRSKRFTVLSEFVIYPDTKDFVCTAVNVFSGYTGAIVAGRFLGPV